MVIAPTAVKYVALTLLSIVWLILFHRTTRTEGGPGRPFHLAVAQRDRRKARFYYLSIWIGLASAFLSLMAVEALSGLVFETTSVRAWVLGIMRGLGLWGLMILTMVWSQVGARVSQPNSDGRSLMPTGERKG